MLVDISYERNLNSLLGRVDCLQEGMVDYEIDFNVGPQWFTARIRKDSRVVKFNGISIYLICRDNISSSHYVDLRTYCCTRSFDGLIDELYSDTLEKKSLWNRMRWR